ncbi:hypothetical protein ACOCJ5_10360 [Knoellia sp. CPCC 206450]|uniref:hypothetical protein n=1 Tax=Knoellia tibetensis TaxID=3404798 RepID=UPI003B43CC6F
MSPLDVPAALALIGAGLLVALWCVWAVLVVRATDRRRRALNLELRQRRYSSLDDIVDRRPGLRA